MRTFHSSIALLAVVGLALTACESDPGSAAGDDPGSKAGGQAAPITITVADSQPPQRPSNLPLEEFAKQVASLSNGSMTVKIVTNATDDTSPGDDTAVIDRVKAGLFEMAVVPARAWSTADVSSMRPLQAPFLVQSEEQINAVVRDQAIVTSLFAGLETVGVHGLTMYPESLRHLFSYTSPILTPDDVKGRQIRYTSSAEVATIIATIGATPVDPPGEDFNAGVANGTITATDSGFTIVGDRPTTATGNLVLYPKVITLVAGSGFWDGLSDSQRDILTTAAQATQDWSIANHVGEHEAAAEYCTAGGTIVLASTQSLADFRAATAPLYADLERDPVIKQTIAAIDALAPTTQDAAVAECAPATKPATDVVARGGDIPNGFYRVEFTQDYLKEHGQNDFEAENNYGVWTHRLEDGQWSLERVAATNTGPSDKQAGVYQVDGNELLWKLSETYDAGLPPLHFTWSVDADGTLHFTEVDPKGIPDFEFDLPWTRVGDL